jgi:hypothetical protein
MNEIDHFKVFVLCSRDIVAEVNHLHVKKIYLYLLLFCCRHSLALSDDRVWLLAF